MLRGIDVSSNQPANVCATADMDFAVVKMSGNPQYDANGKQLRWDYVNPSAAQLAGDAMRRTGLVAFYHFTWGKDAWTEADFFVEHVKELGYLGKAMLVIDYEAQALSLGREWVRAMADRIEQLAGYKPVIYASGNVIVAQDLFDIGCPMWCANYSRGYETIYGYDTSGCAIYPGCEGSVMWQFTSQGIVGGYDGTLDLDIFFGTREDFLALCGGRVSSGDLAPVENRGGDVHRLLDTLSGRHMLTISAAEKDVLAANGWSYEGVAFKAGVGVNPVFRMYHPRTGQHFWTTDYNEADTLHSGDWKYEGVPFFSREKGAPIYRLYNPNCGDHLWTADVKERDDLKGQGWTYEGVAFEV